MCTYVLQIGCQKENSKAYTVYYNKYTFSMHALGFSYLDGIHKVFVFLSELAHHLSLVAVPHASHYKHHSTQPARLQIVDGCQLILNILLWGGPGGGGDVPHPPPPPQKMLLLFMTSLGGKSHYIYM